MKVYITGNTKNEKCKEQFATAKFWLQKQGNNETILATDFDKLPLNGTERIRLNFYAIEMCDCVYFVDGWQKSKTAVAEHSFAVALGKKVKFENKQWAFKRGVMNDKRSS